MRTSETHVCTVVSHGHCEAVYVIHCNSCDDDYLIIRLKFICLFSEPNPHARIGRQHTHGRSHVRRRMADGTAGAGGSSDSNALQQLADSKITATMTSEEATAIIKSRQEVRQAEIAAKRQQVRACMGWCGVYCAAMRRRNISKV